MPRISKARERQFRRWLLLHKAELDRVAREEAAAVAAGRRVPVSALREALKPYLALQGEVDNQVGRMLREALADLDDQLASIAGRKGIGAATRRAELMQSRSAILKSLKEIWKETGNIIAANYAGAAQAAAESVSLGNKAIERVLKAAYSPEEVEAYRRSMARIAEQQVLSATARVAGVGRHGLSERVWRSRKVIEGQVERAINSALAMNLSAAEFAQRVRPFLSPAVPGGPKYAAMRLARTEINNAFHAAAQKQMEENPWTEAAKWNLSGSHPRADKCDEYAEHRLRSYNGIGIWDISDIPGKPHPQCLCYITAVTIDPDEFMDNLIAGNYDDIIVNDDGSFTR